MNCQPQAPTFYTLGNQPLYLLNRTLIVLIEQIYKQKITMNSAPLEVSTAKNFKSFTRKFERGDHTNLQHGNSLHCPEFIFIFIFVLDWFFRRCYPFKPTGHVMHQQFNIQQLYVLPTLHLCVLYLSENKQRLVPLTA